MNRRKEGKRLHQKKRTRPNQEIQHNDEQPHPDSNPTPNPELFWPLLKYTCNLEQQVLRLQKEKVADLQKRNEFLEMAHSNDELFIKTLLKKQNKNK